MGQSDHTRPGLPKEQAAVTQDITARKEAEQRLQTIFDEAPIGMVIVGKDSHFLQVNKWLCEMLGYSATELVGRTFMDITHPEDVAADVALAEQIFRGAIPRYQLEKRYLKKSGQILWIQLTAAVVRRSDGQPLYGIGLIEDITPRKDAEVVLKRERDQLVQANQVMMKREARILELKQEVNEFCKQSGSPPKYNV